MPRTHWDERFFASTRGHVVVLLRRSERTVDDLAQALGLTDNAVRSHLATLERDGLVRQSGLRRGDGKPSQLYSLTPEAERLFPKAYAPVLRHLLDVLSERVPASQAASLLRETGRRLAVERPLPTTDDTRARLDRAAQLLSELGGLAEVESEDGVLRLRGYSCPLTAVVGDHPEVCQLAEAMLSEATGLPIQERCLRKAGEPPRCCFEVEV